MDYPAVVIVLCLAGAVNRRATIQPKALDTGWVVVPNLWGGIIAPPGFMKSPVIQTAARPLNQIQTEWRKEHEDALKEFAQAKEEYDLKHQAWKEQFKANTKRSKITPNRAHDVPEQPTLRRLIVNDATFEALHQTMRRPGWHSGYPRRTHRLVEHIGPAWPRRRTRVLPPSMERRYRPHHRPNWAWNDPRRSVLHIHAGRYSANSSSVSYLGEALKDSTAMMG